MNNLVEQHKMAHAAQSGKRADYKGRVRVNCPFCLEVKGTPDRRSSLVYYRHSGYYKCLAGDTMVLTKDGTRPIKDLAGREVDVLTFYNKAWRWVRAPFFECGVQPLWRVTLSRNGVKKVILATADHRWIAKGSTRRKPWREVVTRDLKKGHALRSARLPRSGNIVPSPWCVEHVECCGDEGMTYCCEVPGSHTFVLEGHILTGNCFRCRTFGHDFLHGTHAPVQHQPRVFKQTGGPEGFTPLWTPTVPWEFQAAVEYLERRKITQQYRARAFIGACLTGRYAFRVIIPHLDEAGDWWGWTARTWVQDPSIRKVDYPPNMRRDRLYNQQALSVESDRPVMVVEGALDAVFYLPDVVACLGQPTKDHLDILKESRRPLALCLDADAARSANGLLLALKLAGKKVGSVRLPPGTDPNDVNPLWLRDKADRCVDG